MKSLNKVFAATALALIFAAAVTGQAADDKQSMIIKMCEQSPDGKVSKADVMKHVEKMFDKHDSRKEGKLDKAQAERFLKDLTYSPG